MLVPKPKVTPNSANELYPTILYTIYTPYMTVYLVICLPKVHMYTIYIRYTIYAGLFDPTHHP